MRPHGGDHSGVKRPHGVDGRLVHGILEVAELGSFGFFDAPRHPSVGDERGELVDGFVGAEEQKLGGRLGDVFPHGDGVQEANNRLSATHRGAGGEGCGEGGEGRAEVRGLVSKVGLAVEGWQGVGLQDARRGVWEKKLTSVEAGGGGGEGHDAEGIAANGRSLEEVRFVLEVRGKCSVGLQDTVVESSRVLGIDAFEIRGKNLDRLCAVSSEVAAEYLNMPLPRETVADLRSEPWPRSW